MERLASILARVVERAPDGRRFDGEGYRLDCCDACPTWAISRRAIAVHRVHCAAFERTVLVPSRRASPDPAA